MILPRLFNHGQLRDIKVDKDKVTFEGTFGKAEFHDTSGDPLPTGGTPGQVLTKYGDDDEDIYWADVNQVPTNGTQGQVLTKYGSGATDFAWSTPAGGTSIPELTICITFGSDMYMSFDASTSDVTEFDPNYTGDYRISLKFTPQAGVTGMTISDYTLIANYIYQINQDNYSIYFPTTFIAVGNVPSGRPKVKFARSKIDLNKGLQGWSLSDFDYTTVSDIVA